MTKQKCSIEAFQSFPSAAASKKYFHDHKKYLLQDDNGAAWLSWLQDAIHKIKYQKQRPNVERVAACIRQHHPQYSNDTVFQVRRSQFYPKQHNMQFYKGVKDDTFSV